jgi:hypothetical protein
MDYASSYAMGGPMQPQYAAADVVLPAPPPRRMHWSTMVFVAGMAFCALSLFATLAGVPAKLGYDTDGSPVRNKPDSMDPMAISRSLDGNMKWIDQASSDHEDGYVGYIKSINQKEVAIPAMVQALVAMNASVIAIDTGLADVGATTTQMGKDMQAMSDISTTSSHTMSGLSGDIGFLSTAMVELAGSTQELTTRMAGIEKKASGIADGGTSAALKSAKELNASLPATVPMPTTTDGVPLDQAMRKLAEGGGGTGAETTGADTILDAYHQGAVQ